MKSAIIVVALMMGGCGGKAGGPVAAPEPTQAQTGLVNARGVEVIDGFLADPENVNPAVMLEAVSNDGAVEVKVPGALVEALFVGVEDERAVALLFAGFVAGNARPQFVDGVKRDRFASGVEGALRVYVALGLSTPAMEEARAAQGGGTLDAWASEWLAKHPSPSAE